MFDDYIIAYPERIYNTFEKCYNSTSVTTVCTEERRNGIAYLRVTAFGDISHLNIHGEPPAFAGRFCETFGNTEQRHD